MSIHKVVLADDHALIRQGLKKIIEEEQSLRVIGEVGDGLELLNFLHDTTPDLIILDISMPNLRGIEAIAEAKKLCPNVKILLLTMHKNEQYFNCAMSAGADGYMLKEDSDSELLDAIAKVLEDKVYISTYFSEIMSKETIISYKNKDRQPPCETLTTRERQVLKLVAEGETSKEMKCPIARLPRLGSRVSPPPKRSRVPASRLRRKSRFFRSHHPLQPQRRAGPPRPRKTRQTTRRAIRHPAPPCRGGYRRLAMPRTIPPAS